MRILFGIILAAGIAALGVGLGPAWGYSPPVRLALVIGGLVTIVAILIWVPRLMNRREIEQMRADVEQAGLLAQRIEATGEKYNLGKRGQGLLTAALMTLIAVLFLLVTLETPLLKHILLCGVWITLTFLAWVIAIPCLRAPPLCVTRDGVETALFGYIPWEAIDAVAPVMTKGRVRAIRFFGADLDALYPQMHPCGRILRLLSFGNARAALSILIARREGVCAHRLAYLLWGRRIARSRNGFDQRLPTRR